MSRIVLVLALWCVTASTALAKDLCIQFNTGTFAGSHLVVKSVKLGKRSVGSVEGHLAEYTGGSGFSYFRPIHGGSLVSRTGNVFLAVAIHDVRSDTIGGYSIGNGPIIAVNYVCSTGADGKIGVLDICSGYVGGVNASGHVVECSATDAIPD